LRSAPRSGAIEALGVFADNTTIIGGAGQHPEIQGRVEQILRRALDAPTRQIAENSAVDGGIVVARMLDGKVNYGFDAGRKEYVDLVEAGIIDPTEVVRIALENAVSVAGVLLLTEATMTEIPEPARERPPEADMAM
jgi:chaperonin GroEL